MESIVQHKIIVNGKYSIFHIFDWQWQDVKPAPFCMEGECTYHHYTMYQPLGAYPQNLNMTKCVQEALNISPSDQKCIING